MIAKSEIARLALCAPFDIAADRGTQTCCAVAMRAAALALPWISPGLPHNHCDGGRDSGRLRCLLRQVQVDVDIAERAADTTACRALQEPKAH